MLTVELGWSLYNYMAENDVHIDSLRENRGARIRRRKIGNRAGKKTLQVPDRVQKQEGVDKKFGSKRKERSSVYSHDFLKG